MKKNGLLICYDKDLRLHVNYPEARKEISNDVVRFIRPAPGMNFVSFTFADGPELGGVIGREVNYLAPMDQPFTWKVYDHDPLPGMGDALLANGFLGDDDPSAVMVFDLNQEPATGIEAANAKIRRITDRDGLRDIVHVLDGVYGGNNNWVYERMRMHLQSPGYLSIYVAYVDGKPASIGWTVFPGRHFATLYGGTTLPEYRQRGLYTSLLHLRLREIRERGYPFAVVETGPMSKPIVEKHGFRHLTTVHEYKWQGG
ncbi:MAG TPA: GNAT family N-acetyltransferase [Anaerolineales bacterium]